MIAFIKDCTKTVQMNGAQLHLSLNHLPVVISIIALGILAWGWFCKNSDIKKVGLVLVIAAAGFAGAAFLTGEPAEEVIEKMPIFSEELVHAHEEAGEAALIVSIVAGIGALASLFLSKKKEQLASYAFAVTFFVLVLSSIAFLRTAHLGGLIHHEEIRSETSNP